MSTVVFIHPGNSKKIYQELANELTAVEPPVWASLLASFHRVHGHQAIIVDAEAERLSAEQVAKRIDDIQPTLAVIVVYGHQPSASTQNMAEASRLASAMKAQSPTVPVLLLGGHVAALPSLVLEQEECDFVATGEGLITSLELLEALGSSSPRLHQVRGLGFRDGDRVEFTPPAPLLRDLDGLMPRQAWDLLDMSLYRAHNWHCFGEKSRRPYASVYTTLGCPYHCSFCCIQAPFKSGEAAEALDAKVNSYRRWSPLKVVDQLEFLAREHGVRHVKFADEMFVLNRNHVEGICREILRRKLSLNIWAYARVDTVKDGTIALLREAGFSWLALGIESGNESVRDDVGKGVSRDQIFNVVGKLQQAGIRVIGNFIFGLPEDTHESMEETLRMARELRCDFANFYSAMAYPGSQLFERAQAEGLPLPETWEGYSQHSFEALPLPTRHLSGAEVLEFRDKAFHRYYEDPDYLQFLEREFGAKVREEIEDMTKVRLRRRHQAVGS